MEELNKTKSVDTFEEDSFDTMTLTNLGDAFALSQIAEDGTLHNVILGPNQLERLADWAREMLG